MCKRIRERAEWRHIKIIMLSAKGRDAEVTKGLAMGADLYVTKPFSTRDLMARIDGCSISDEPRLQFVTAPKVACRTAACATAASPCAV